MLFPLTLAARIPLLPVPESGPSCELSSCLLREKEFRNLDALLTPTESYILLNFSLISVAVTEQGFSLCLMTRHLLSQRGRMQCGWAGTQSFADSCKNLLYLYALPCTINLAAASVFSFYKVPDKNSSAKLLLGATALWILGS